MAAQWEDGCYSALIPRLKPVLRPEDRFSIDALGVSSYALMDHYVYDMWGLTDRETARIGTYGRQMGRNAASYNFNVIKPNIILAHAVQWQFDMLQKESGGRYAQVYDTYYLSGLPTCQWTRMYIAFRKEHADRIMPALAEWAPQPVQLPPG